MTVVSTGFDTQTKTHPFSAPIPGEYEVAFRILGSQREGQVLRIAGEKFTVGSGPGCSLCLRSAHVAPVHLVGIHGPVGTLVRAMATDTRLDGRTFADAWVKIGDRLSVGPIDLEVLDLTTPFTLSDHPPTPHNPLSTSSVCDETSLAHALRHASNQARSVRQIEHARTRRLLAEIKSLREKQTQQLHPESPAFDTIATTDLQAENSSENLAAHSNSPTPQWQPLAEVPSACDDVTEDWSEKFEETPDALFHSVESTSAFEKAADDIEDVDHLERIESLGNEAPGSEGLRRGDFVSYDESTMEGPTPYNTTQKVEGDEEVRHDDPYDLNVNHRTSNGAMETDDALAKIRASLASLLMSEQVEDAPVEEAKVEEVPVARETEIERVRRLLLEEYQRQEEETASQSDELQPSYLADLSRHQNSAAELSPTKVIEEPATELTEETDQGIANLYRLLAERSENHNEDNLSNTQTESSDLEVEIEAEADESPSWVKQFAAADESAEPEEVEEPSEHFSTTLYDTIASTERPVAESTPALSMNKVAETHAPQRSPETRSSASAQHEEPNGDDESIDAYMTKLLARLGGTTTPDPVRPTRSSGTSDSVHAPAETEALLKQTFGQELQAREQEFQAGPYVPRVAPERMEDLKTLRDVANAQAAAAIDISSRKKRSSSSLLWVAGSVFGVLLGGLLLKTSTSPLSISFFLSIVSFGGTIFSIRQVLDLRKTTSVSRRFETVKELPDSK